MNPAFFQKIEGIIHTERIDAYRQDGVDEKTTLSRYLLNMALSEALYPALQFSEIALRNAVHRELSARCGTDTWYDSQPARLTGWQKDKVNEAKSSLKRHNKSLSPGRIIAELNFGFWTGFFNKPHARTGIGAYLSKRAFPHAPITEQVQSKLAQRWTSIRDLRNRVFHHERIIHWGNLDQRHQSIFEIIEWMSPELQKLTSSFDRFVSIRKDGLKPWIQKLSTNWPNNASS
jgi:hypothetical protein